MSDVAPEPTTPVDAPAPDAAATAPTPTPAPPAAPVPPAVPADTAVDSTSFADCEISVRRNEAKSLWEAYIVVGGVEWVLAARKLGKMDDLLQEAATPGFLEKRRLYYEREVLGLR